MHADELRNLEIQISCRLAHFMSKYSREFVDTGENELLPQLKLINTIRASGGSWVEQLYGKLERTSLHNLKQV